MNVSPDADRDGRVYGLTWPQPIAPWGKWELRVLFWVARHMRWVPRPLVEMAVVRGLYWSILTHVPDGHGRRHRLPQPVLFFDASFDVDLRRYIEIFSEVLRWRFRAVWGSGYLYPGVMPAQNFLAWVDDNRVPPSHYWCAYPEATTRMVRSGLRINAHVTRFDAATADVDDEQFAHAFRQRLLPAVANDL